MVRCARAAGLALLVACVDGPTGPGSHTPATVRVRVTLPAATPAVWTPIGETLHVSVRRAGRVDPIVDTAFRVADSLVATLNIPLAYAVERFVATAEVRYGGLLLFLGFDALQLSAAVDTVVTVAASYVGPGARAATFALGARDSSLAPGDTASLLPLVRDSAALVIPNVLARYVTSQPSAFTVNGAILTAHAGMSDTSRITGFLPTGQSSALVVRAVTGAGLPGTKTWVGGDAANPTDWSTSSNWNPAGVPSPQDTAIVVSTSGGAGAGNDPVLSGAVTVARLRILGGNLTLNGHAVTVTGDFSTEASAGTVTMRHPDDVLRVLGDAVFAGGRTLDLLTEGVLYIGGDFRQINDGENRDAFQAAQRHRTVLNGSSNQAFSPAGSVSFGHLEFANTGGVIDGQLEQTVLIDGTLRFTTAVAFEGGDIAFDIRDSLVMTVDSRLTTFRVRLSGGMLVAGTLEANETEFAGDNQEIQPGLSYRFVTVTGDARLIGATDCAIGLAIKDDGRLTLNGHALTVPLLDVGRGTERGELVMQRPADQLIVTGDAAFDGDTTLNLLTDGVLRIAGNLSVGSASFRKVFRAVGNHRTVFDGTALQNLTLYANRLTFGHLDVANSAGVEVAAIDEIVEFGVTGKLRVAMPVAFDGHDAEPRHVRIDVGDSLVTVAGSALNLDGLVLRGGIALGGTLNANHVEFAGTNQLIPANGNYHSGTISGTATLTGTTSFDSFFLVRGVGANLTLSGHRLATGDFTTGGIGEPNGTLTMTNPADTLVVTSDVVFAGAPTTGLLTAGTLIVGGGFFQAETPAAFQPSGTHRTVLAGSSQQRVGFEHPATSSFHHVTLANTAGGIWMESAVFVAGELRTAGVTQLISGTSHHLLTVRSVDIGKLTLDTIPLAIGSGALVRFDTVTFQRQHRGAAQLSVTHPGAATPFTFTGLRFLSTPTTGLYVAATDAAASDGAVLTIDLDDSFPADGSSHTTTSGGAVVNWTGGTPPLAFAQLSAGVTFSCAVTTTNVAYCWGINTDGQLGDGTTASRNVPTPVQGGLSFSGIAAGGQHACGITPAGAIYCWGSNAYGQLGDNTTTNRLAPTPIASGLTFSRVTAGDQYTCALGTNQLAYCWGRNTSGQLGDLTTTDRTSPTPVDGNIQFNALVAGINHVCGLSNDVAYCWGSNTSGQLGDGTTTNSATPLLVGGGLGGFSFRNISPGAEHTCAVATGEASGTGYCWGANNFGGLGDGTTTPRTAPTQVAGGILFSSIRTGGNGFTCGVSTAGAGYCWGVNNVGQLGDGTQTQRLTPVAVSGGQLFSAIIPGFAHVLAMSNAAYAWGSNNQGQLGDGTNTLRTTPVLILVPTP